MKAEQRRTEIAVLLTAAKQALPGALLAQKLGVSRQIIVQDIAILRASGYEILSTHEGYLLAGSPLCKRVFKVHHTSERTERELTLIVELGGTVLDVYVRHKVYGKIEAPLNIFSMHGVGQFMQGIKSGRSTELLHITSGYHYHTVQASDEATLDRIEKALKDEGFLVL